MNGAIKRCVNLDWLEIDALEPTEGLDADFFRSQGFEVEEREYGTRVYGQMFTIIGTDGMPFLEIRRQPKTPMLSENDVHLRLCNRTCYMDNAADLLAQFCQRYQYWYQRIVRVDICLDFEHFDFGDDPKKFIQRYISGKFTKINQSNITAHGLDEWSGRDWNSLSWGSLKSDIGTKMYDKTLELYDASTHEWRKPYIRQAWQKCGLVHDWLRCAKIDANGQTYYPRIWRIEFSIRSNVKGWFLIERDGKAKAKQSIRNNLDMYDNRAKLLTLFASLAQHYFHFKYYEPDKPKYKCPDKRLFDWSDQQYTYKVEKLVSDAKPEKPLSSLLAKIRQYREHHHDQDIQQACRILIRALEDDYFRYEAGTHFTLDELTALRMTMKQRTTGDDTDPAILMRNIKALLKLNDKTAPF